MLTVPSSGCGGCDRLFLPFTSNGTTNGYRSTDEKRGTLKVTSWFQFPYLVFGGCEKWTGNRKQVSEGVGGDRDHRQRRGRLGRRARWPQEPRVCRVSARRGGFSPADLRAPACRSEGAVGATDPAPENHRRETSVSSSLLPPSSPVPSIPLAHLCLRIS